MDKKTRPEQVLWPQTFLPLRPGDVVELTRPRLTVMVLITAGVGYFLAAPGPIQLIHLAAVLAGLGLVVAGSTALNQLIERASDAKMERTRNRPLPAGRVNFRAVFVLGTTLTVGGIALLGLVAGWLTALLAAFSAAVYLLVYTPLKRQTSFNTLVGAISGALPPVIGWSSVAGGLSFGALSLFAIVFVWQLVHLFAIAWLYHADYTRAGLVMVSVVDDKRGTLTVRLIVLFCLSLLPVSMLPAAVGLAGYLYVFCAILLGLGFLAVVFRLAASRTNTDARRLFFASIVYLPALFLVILIDQIV